MHALHSDTWVFVLCCVFYCWFTFRNLDICLVMFLTSRQVFKFTSCPCAHISCPAAIQPEFISRWEVQSWRKPRYLLNLTKSCGKSFFFFLENGTRKWCAPVFRRTVFFTLVLWFLDLCHYLYGLYLSSVSLCSLLRKLASLTLKVLFLL